ncbi:MAG: TRL-like family protein [Leptospira sp.]|nr:TRL-like family protein [Leptospira sp.]
MKCSIYCLLALTIGTFFHASCAIAPTHGLLYTNTNFPGEFNTNNDVLAKRYGTGCQSHYLGLVSIGDAAAGSIAKKHEIRRIATVDHSFTGILFPLYGKYCTIVGGD